MLENLRPLEVADGPCAAADHCVWLSLRPTCLVGVAAGDGFAMEIVQCLSCGAWSVKCSLLTRMGLLRVSAKHTDCSEPACCALYVTLRHVTLPSPFCKGDTGSQKCSDLLCRAGWKGGGIWASFHPQQSQCSALRPGPCWLSSVLALERATLRG